VDDEPIMDMLNLASDVGFPIAAACGGFYFVYLTLKFILDGVLSSVKDLISIIKRLDDRVTAMSHDITRIDILVSNALDLEPDVDRVARVKKADARKD
jgi:cobyrinic acid a,c-diamide synthase